MVLVGKGWERQIAKTIELLKTYVKAGLVPAREHESYDHNFEYVNCLEHALFNLTNAQIETLHHGLTTEEIFGEIDDIENPEQEMTFEKKVENKMRTLAKKVGLKVSTEYGKNIVLAKNQWRIALYTHDIAWHFALQERDGTWSAKECWTDRIATFEKLTEYCDIYNGYKELRLKLQKTYIITNPYAEAE